MVEATKINFDVGVIQKLDVSMYKNVLVLTGTNFSLDIFEKKIKQNIKTKYHVYPNICSNLTDTLVYQVVNFAMGNEIDCIVSVGVESVMDCGRLVSLLLSHGGFLHSYLQGGKVGPLGITSNMIPHITIPTMPAAGYEISSYASFRMNGIKQLLSSPYLVPKATYIDPLIMTNLPKDLWEIILFDGFATSLMAYVSAYANQTSDAYALQALDSYINHSRKILQEPNNIEYIKHACAESLNAYLAVNYSSTGAVHAMADAIVARFGMRYGTALACVCSEVCAFLYDSNQERFDHISKMLGGEVGSAKAIKASIDKLIKEVGIHLPSFKLSQSEVEKLAMASMNIAMRGSTKQMTEQDVIAILRRLP